MHWFSVDVKTTNFPVGKIQDWCSPLLHTPTPAHLTPGNSNFRNNTPKTPTPFKIAMAELGKKSGLKYEPSSPGLLVADITEMIQREESCDTIHDSLISVAQDNDMELPNQVRITINRYTVCTNVTKISDTLPQPREL
ncbi:hypothetical protein ACJJTC_016858 [Scirpophaga incertulas]